MSTYQSDDADEFLAEAKQRNPERYAELEKRFPIESQYDRLRHKLGEPLTRSRKRRENDGLGSGRYVPLDMRRQFTDEEWTATKKAWQRGEREHDALERAAKEQAQGVY